MNHLSLFSGIGGIDLAADWAGMKTIAFCEREPFPQKVLKKHWPDVPIYDDVCTLTKERLENDGIDTRTIGIISGGYPCQPFSHAGKREGENDDRHLWPEVKRLLEEIRPRWFVGENVAGHVTLGLDIVLSDLADIGYTGQPFIIPSSAVGAPHKRERVFIVGYTEHIGLHGSEIRGSIDKASYNNEKGAKESSKPKGASGSKHYEVMGDSTSEGLQGWRQSEWDESEEEAGAGMESEFERSGEDVAYTNDEGVEGRENTGSISQNWAESRNKYTGGRCKNKSRGSAQSELGRSLDGIYSGLDKHRWPAGLGAEQFDWEPPRVSTGVKDRVGRLKALGNAVNPHQIYPILAAIKAIDDTLKEE